MSSGVLQRARLTPTDGSAALDLHYNPSTLTLVTGSRWQFQATRNAPDAAVPEWAGAEQVKITMDALLDGVDDPRRSVVAAVATLVGWTRSSPDSRRRNVPQASLLTLDWGTQTYGPLFLQSLQLKYTMFDPDGLPLRATATLTLAEVKAEAEGTNPTSGGPPGRRSAVLGAGDSLPALAHREYGDPALWRALARANGVDDPARLPAGTALLVPPLDDAHRLLAGDRA